MKRLSMLLCCGMAFFCLQKSSAQEVITTPTDGVVKRTLINERRALAYEPVREADILWEKKIWRVIDIREKINLPFSYPNQPFFDVINKAVLGGKIQAYSTINDRFTVPLSMDEVSKMMVKKDTITIYNPDVGYEEVKFVDNEISSEAVQKFRIKEDWFFDKESGRMEVRILGFAPLLDVYDEAGNFRFTRPLYWVYYPDCRTTLAKTPFVSVADNDANPMSWEDAIEMRMFSSYITKESNIYDRRLEDYASGVDLLLEGQKIHNSIFDFEHDMWSF